MKNLYQNNIQNINEITDFEGRFNDNGTLYTFPFVLEGTNSKMYARCNKTSTSNIIRSIRLDYLLNNKHFSTQFFSQYSQAHLKQLKITKVYQYDLKGNFIAEYKSQTEACKTLGKHLQINVAIKMGRTCGGFQWNYEKLSKMPDISKQTSGKARRVGQYDLQGNLIHIFKTNPVLFFE